ncbi:MAG: GntR family transcriptional regulator [Pseudomonadota bacterium]
MSKPLKLSIRTGDPRAIFKQVVDAISLAIARNELEEGDKLPSVRALAMQLSVNPNTIAKAYAELTAQGLLDARQGLGLFISAPKQLLSREERSKRLRAAVQRLVNDVAHLHYSDDEVLRMLATELGRIRTVSKTGGAA